MSEKSWSFSQWTQAVSCLRHYKLATDGAKPSGQTSSDLAFGSAIHVALDAMFNQEDADAVFIAYWRMQKDANLEYFRYKHDDLEVLGLDFLSRFRRLHLGKYKRHMGEQRLYAEYRGVKLEGTADWVGEYNGLFTLADWKTSSTAYDKDRALIATQLHLYAYLVHKNTDIKLEQLMYVPFVKSTGAIQNPVVIPFSEKAMLDHLDSFVDYVALIEGQDTWPKNSGTCMKYGNRKCEYFNGCWGMK